MSTDFALRRIVSASELFDGRLSRFGLEECTTESNAKTDRQITIDPVPTRRRYITDGQNIVCVYISETGLVGGFSWCENNDPRNILAAVAKACDTDFVSEYAPEYWGFSTEEELDAWREELDNQAVTNFYNRLIKHLRGEECDLETIDDERARIAKELTDNDSTLLLPENKGKLLAMIERPVTLDNDLSDEDIAKAELAAVRRDDLPRA
jgi:hypothetical protein